MKKRNIDKEIAHGALGLLGIWIGLALLGVVFLFAILQA